MAPRLCILQTTALIFKDASEWDVLLLARGEMHTVINLKKIYCRLIKGLYDQINAKL